MALRFKLLSKKAQANLESLIVIGGAILIAAVIITLIVTVGGQGRNSASSQGDDVSSSIDGPLAPTITSVEAKYNDCFVLDPSVSSDKIGLLTFSWNPLSSGGVYKLIIENSREKVIGNYNYTLSSNGVLLDSKNLNHTILGPIIVSDISLGNGNCGDTYYLSIEVNKNNQTKTSVRYPFRWVASGSKTTVVSRPILVPPAGVYNIENFPLSVSISSEPLLTVYYTLDGTDPINSSSRILYDGTNIVVTPGSTIKTVSESGGLYSSVLTGTYTDSYYTVSSVEATPGSQINLVDPFSVTLQTQTSSAIIYYTLDGSTPDCSGSFDVYSSSITGFVDTTIKAIACKENYLDSPVSTFTYTFFEPLLPVTIHPPSGNYTSLQNVTLSSSNVGAVIRYTTTGVDPTVLSPIYSIPFVVSSTSTIKAIAFVNSFYSPISSETYVITLPAIAPTFSPSSGTYNNNLSVLMSSTTPLPYSIYYTLDGSEPDENGLLYTGAGVLVASNTTLKARVYKNDWSPSPVTTATYNFAYSAPSFTPVAGAYSDSQLVTINAPAGSLIRYTLDGSTPTQSVGTQILPGESTIPITSSSTLKAIAYRTGWNSSPVASGVYTINAPAASVSFSPSGGTFTNNVSVGLSCVTPSSTIRYTTDGSTPSRTEGTVYSGALSLTSTTTLKAVCYANGYSTGPVVSNTYTILLIALAPTITPNGGSFSTITSATLSSATPLPYTIRYTTDGIDPTSSSTEYLGSAVPILQNTVLKAKVFKAGYTDSPTTSSTFNFTYATPTFSPTAPSNHEDTVSVQINAAAGASIRYTLDGSTPTQSVGTQILPGEFTIPITSSSTLKAIAYRTGWNSSPVASGVYTINAPAASVSFSPSGGTFTNNVSVGLSCVTPSSTIRYTTDGSTPSRTEGTVYSGALSLTSTTTLKAVCYANGYSTGPVVSNTYTIIYPPGAVTVTGGGPFCSSASLTATGGTGGLIYFQGTTSNGTSTTNQSSTAQVTSSGTYYFRAYNSTTNLWGNQGFATVTINTPSVAPTSISGNTSVCSGQSTTLTAVGGTQGTNANYQWYAGGCGSGSVLGTSSSITVSPTSTTSYYARLSGSCNVTSCVSTTVTISPLPVVNVTTASRCGTGTLTLGATTTSGTIQWYSASTGGTLLGTGNSFTTPSISSTTTYYVGVTGGTCDLTTRTPVTATINALPPTPTVSLQSSSCGSATIAASGTEGTIYYQGTNSTGTSTSLGGSPKTITSNGTYYFRTLSSNGCWGNSQGITVTVPQPTLLLDHVYNDTTGFTHSSGSQLRIDSSRLTPTWGIPAGGYVYRGSTSQGNLVATSVVYTHDLGRSGILFNLNSGNYYDCSVQRSDNTLKLSYNGNVISSVPYSSIDIDKPHVVKIESFGSSKKCKAWPGTDLSSEPANWNINVTHSSSNVGQWGSIVIGFSKVGTLYVQTCN